MIQMKTDKVQKCRTCLKLDGLKDFTHIFDKIFNNVKIINNARKRISKNTAFYFYCGGGYDTESTTIKNDNGMPECAFIYHVQIMLNGYYIVFRYLDNITRFFRQLSEYLKNIDDKSHLIIWVANLSHEFAFFKRQLKDVGSMKIFAKSQREILHITLCENIEFRECIGLFGVSLSDIADKHTTTKKLKGDLDYNKIRTPDTPLKRKEKRYCYNDVKILDELSYVAFNMFTFQALKIPLTKTGKLRNKCKSKIQNIKFEYDNNAKLMPATIDEYVKMRKFLYNGGLSGGNAFYNGVLLHNVCCCDLTSDYPAQMFHNMFPSGELIKCSNPVDVFKHTYCNYIVDITFKWIRAKTIHCSVSEFKVLNVTKLKKVLKNNGKILYAENIRLMFNEIDLQAFNMMYEYSDDITINESYYFTKSARIPKFLRECISDDYMLKNELKEKGLDDTLEYKLSKESVNSYYGMCATRLYDCNFTFDIDSDIMISESTGIKELDELIKQGATDSDIYKELKQKQYNNLKSHVWLNPYIAYWCTSYARLILCDFISSFPDLIIQYDTDSIYFCCDESIVDVKRLEQLKEKIHEYNLKIERKNKALFNGNKHFETLGQWDIAKPYTDFKTLGAKRYIYRKEDGKIKSVVAGLVRGTLEKQAKINNIDIFDFFSDNMKISSVYADKLASSYYDGDSKLIRVTDCNDNETVVKVGTYHALYNIEFTLEIASELRQLINAMDIEKALPYDNRIITHTINKMIGDKDEKKDIN